MHRTALITQALRGRERTALDSGSRPSIEVQGMAPLSASAEGGVVRVVEDEATG